VKSDVACQSRRGRQDYSEWEAPKARDEICVLVEVEEAIANDGLDGRGAEARRNGNSLCLLTGQAPSPRLIQTDPVTHFATQTPPVIGLIHNPNFGRLNSVLLIRFGVHGAETKQNRRPIASTSRLSPFDPQAFRSIPLSLRRRKWPTTRQLWTMLSEIPHARKRCPSTKVSTRANDSLSIHSV
jgi:hypothetical protein